MTQLDAKSLLRACAALVALALSACGSAVVGAECAPGFSRCGESCVDLQRNADHCGSCDQGCGSFECRDAVCGPGLRPDRDGGSVGDGGAVIPSGPPFLSDGGFAFPDVGVGRGCSLGQSTCGQGCVNLRGNASHCGQCGSACPSGEYCLDGACMACDPPLTLCGACVDLQTHADHCGNCNTTCRSGICENGDCTDLLSGHVVLIGHDYAGARAGGTAMRMVGNAVFLATGSPVRTVVYEGTASINSIRGVTAAIEYVVDRDGRPWAPRSVAADDLVAELFEADALLVHAQVGSSDAELLELGQQIGLAMSQFLVRGGVIVVIEAPSANNLGTFQMLEPAGLFEAGARESISEQTLEVVELGVGVAVRATRTYRRPEASVRFLGVSSVGTAVVRDRDGETVVFQRIVVP